MVPRLPPKILQWLRAAVIRPEKLGRHESDFPVMSTSRMALRQRWDNDVMGVGARGCKENRVRLPERRIG